MQILEIVWKRWPRIQEWKGTSYFFFIKVRNKSIFYLKNNGNIFRCYAVKKYKYPPREWVIKKENDAPGKEQSKKMQNIIGKLP